MANINLNHIDVRIPVFDLNSRRLLKIPKLKKTKLGAETLSHGHSSVQIHALNDISLNLVDGDRLSLIGHNGSGKTTLLRLIAGIYQMNAGTKVVKGTIFSLLGSAVSITPDATGYENIRMAALFYDWPKDQYDEFVYDIEQFTDLGEYLSMPTAVYSAGMAARLAFAIATVKSYDILLIDEGIGAGDANFQAKAQERIQRFVGGAGIVVLASHSPDLCRRLCNKGLVLTRGRQAFAGSIDDAFEYYDTL
jgi:ABC-type polysaccharide/polyol phosphate transport system ATPase subunit